MKIQPLSNAAGPKGGKETYLEDLLYSFNVEKATMIRPWQFAEHIGGSVQMMNASKGDWLLNTHFVTPDGLDSACRRAFIQTTAKSGFDHKAMR